MESLIARQSDIISNITIVKVNFNKDSDSRKNIEYIKKRIETLDNFWGEFEENHQTISEHKSEAVEYFLNNIYQKGKELYQSIRNLLSSYGKLSKSTQPDGKLDELLGLQRTNFRALSRLIKGIKVDIITDKWELEDELKNVQSKWKVIDAQHLQIDHILAGGDISYDEEFTRHELAYKNIKRELNKKISSTTHLEKSTPQLEIPAFSGNYNQWPTFYDLFTETIHNNNSITKAQKMQHLKGKLKGEAERLIYHLHISSENYDTAWEILLHRYNNSQVLFTNQIEIFLNQPIIQKQSSFEIKRLYDTTTECIHAIHNLGVDTNTWDPLLVHLLCKKLDSDTYADYMEARKTPRDLPALGELMSFLESKFTALEPIHKNHKEPSTSIKRTLNESKMSNNYNKHNNYKGFSNRNYQAVTIHTSKCPVCNLNHNRNLSSCKKFLNMPPDVQLRTVTKSKICQNCLFSHDGSQCTSTKRCKTCQGDHHTILHEACMASSKSVPQATSSSSATTESSPKSSNKNPNVNHVAHDDEELLLTTLSINVRCSDGTYVTLRALLDQGSQVSLISENAVQQLGLQRQRYNASVSGIGSGARQSKGLVSIDCQSIYGDYQFTTEALVLSRVANNLPSIPFKKQSWSHLQHLQLADPEYNVSKPIDILLDVSVYSLIIMDGLIKGPAQAPIAQQTALGWILSGNIRTFNCHIVTNDVTDISKYWEIEDVDISSSLTSEDQYCEEFYQKSTRRLETGRYEVGIPMKPEYENQLGSSKSQAVAQFKQLERKMCNNLSFAENYKSFMTEYQQLGHMCNANNVNESKCAFYLPHHGVMKLDSTTTKFRVVFNASAKSSSGKSLNDLMCCGPNLQKDLMTLILNWRTYKYVITADIEKMFRQIFIRQSDQHLQSIIWRQSPQELLREYHLTTVTYGTKTAPYLAMRTLKQLAVDDADKYPLAASALNQSFYMDDLLTGENTIDQARELQQQLIEMLKGAGMNLRKWSSNEPELLGDLSSDQLNSPFDFKCSESRKTLGLRWNSSTDSFSFQNQLQYHNKRITKRQLLSDISKLFDPLGWLSPLSIRAKLLFQNAWSSNLSWDEEIPQSYQDDWIQLRNDFKTIDQFIIPRYLGNTHQLYQIHAFCDASDKAYACVVYVVSKDDKGEYTSRLAIAKTKLAPLAKKVTLPRLELCGALLLSQLIKKVKESFSNQNLDIYAWTDSMIVLGWIQGDVKRWKQFVANRIIKIIDIVPSSCWHHVRSEENAADCATRGLTSQKLLSHPLWWQGPKWINNFDRGTLPVTSYQSPDLEIKNFSVNTALHLNHISFIHELLHNYSSLTRLVRIVAWASRFITRTRRKFTESTDILTSSEMDNALSMIIKNNQSYEFHEDIQFINQKGHVHPKSKISCLDPFKDDCGILRVGGRLKNACISDASKHPIILSSHSRLTDLIIHQAHMTTLHGGPRLTLSYIRNRYWIISGIRTVKRKLRSCAKCQRFSPSKYHQIMADLPPPRVTPSRPFAHTGVDFTGHVELKANKGRGIKTSKGYIAIFVCLSTKAVHLELVSDLSSPAFLAAFRRFSARRGTPCHVYSDNGSNFVGANRIIKKEYQDIIATINTDFFNNIHDMRIQWHFNAPAWPSAGGLWEAAVKSLKYHLKRIIGDQKLTYEEFTTLLHQIEACLNSRPLCQLTESPDDEYLSPGHFLVGGPLLSRPQTDPNHINLSTRWQLIQSMNKQLWKRWSSEYLQQLQARSKWRKPNRNFEVDDIVLIKEENLPPGKWALGRIQEVHPGKDGYVRVASIKTKNTIMKRPVSKLVLLPIEKDSTQDKNINQERSSLLSLSSSNQDERDKSTRRPRNTVSFKNLFISTLILFLMLLSPAHPQNTQNQESYNVTSLDENQAIYFDRVSNLQYIKDEWRLVVYYNMTTYWNGLSDIKGFVDHIKSLCITQTSKQYQSIIFQLEHEISEIDHYNLLLKYQSPKRQRRGLVNGVGYIANSLFGVLDERFAEKYKSDIEQISHNERHLQNLIKNQTSILESEFNIIRRNEDVMNKQFSFIKQRLQDMTLDINQVRMANQDGLYITSSALAASIILSNIRWIQQTLIGTVTDISHGRIDSHLLSPEQLSYQLSIISSQLNGKLMIPVELRNIKDLYQLLKVSARVVPNYLIIEVKVPLLSNELFELNKIISITQRRGQQYYYLHASIPFIAYNLRKDTALLLSETDLQSCTHVPNDIFLCTLNMPIYDLKMKQSVCDIKIINQQELCKSVESTCEQQWIKLHRSNTWLYTCCSECQVRIICTGGVTMANLIGNGIITLGQGCTLKGDTFSIYAHNNFFNHLNVHDDIEVPEVSVLNRIMKTSVPDNVSKAEDHQLIWNRLRAQIDEVKEQSSTDLSIHDVHHYTVLYISVTAVIMLGGVVVYLIKQRRATGRPSASPAPQGQKAAGAGPVTIAPAVLVPVVESVNKCSEVFTISGVDKATSPEFSSSVHSLNGDD